MGGVQPRNLLPASVNIPSLNEDWNVCVTRLGTACMTSSRFSAGLRNEVAPAELRPSWVDLGTEGVRPLKETRGNIVQSDQQVPGFQHEMVTVQARAPTEVATPHALFGWMTRSLTSQPDAYGREFWRYMDAVANVVTGIVVNLWRVLPGSAKAEVLATNAWNRRWWYGPRKWTFWRRSSWTLPQTTTAATDAQSSDGGVPTTPECGDPIQSLGQSSIDAFAQHDYHVDDDEEEDDDWTVQQSRETSVFSEASVTSDVTVTGERSATIEDSPATLIADLLSAHAASSAVGVPRGLAPYDDNLQPVLLAHMTSSSPGPLTRRSYSRLLAQASLPSHSQERLVTNDAVERYIGILQHRRADAASRRAERDEDEEERKRMCVVCTVEPRDTILWPCR
jgi:hypothetical protein